MAETAILMVIFELFKGTLVKELFKFFYVCFFVTFSYEYFLIT